MEHLQHFGLTGDPFRNDLRPSSYFQTPASRDALMRLERGIRQERGLMLFTGDVGVGKSLVVRQLLDNLEEEIFEASLVVLLKPVADKHWLLTRFAKLLGIEEPAEQVDRLLGEVYEQLAIVREEGRHAVLIVDDADALAAAGALADVCGLLKLEYEERRLFTLVLAGGSRLAQAVASDTTIQQHTELHVHMQPLDSVAGTFYLNKRLEQAGGDTSLLDPAAAAAIYTTAGGRPGLMNAVADNALYEAFLAGRRRVATADVTRAHADLGWSAIGEPSPLASAAAQAPMQRAPSGLSDASASAEATIMLDVDAEEAEPADLFAPVQAAGGDLDSDLDAVFATTDPIGAESGMPTDGPPKDESEEDLVVALFEE